MGPRAVGARWVLKEGTKTVMYDQAQIYRDYNFGPLFSKAPPQVAKRKFGPDADVMVVETKIKKKELKKTNSDLCEEDLEAFLQFRAMMKKTKYAENNGAGSSTDYKSPAAIGDDSEKIRDSTSDLGLTADDSVSQVGNNASNGNDDVASAASSAREG